MWQYIIKEREEKNRETVSYVGNEVDALANCGGINPYTLTARLGPGGLTHYETSSRLDPTTRSFAQGNKTWRSSRILVG